MSDGPSFTEGNLSSVYEIFKPPDADTSAPKPPLSPSIWGTWGSVLTAPLIHRDREYYFENVVFQVGNVIFCVPKSGFQVPGTIFEAMFSLPAGGDASQVEGTSEDRPIVLADIPTSHFRSFLKVLYPFYNVQLQYDDWVGALALSTMWDFQQIRGKAITALTPLLAHRPLPETIVLAKKYRIKNWLRDSYTRFVTRPEILTIQDFVPLDWETTAKLFSARDTAARTVLAQNFYCNTCAVWTGPSYTANNERCDCRRKELVENLFKDEFAAMEVPEDMINDSKSVGKKGKKKKGRE